MKKIIDVEKLTDKKYLNLFELVYETEKGEKPWIHRTSQDRSVHFLDSGSGAVLLLGGFPIYVDIH